MIIASLLTMEPALLTEGKVHVVFKCFLYADCRDKYAQLFVTDDLTLDENVWMYGCAPSVITHLGG